MISVLLSFLGGFFTALFAEPLRRRIYQPVLTLQFRAADHFVAKTPETIGNSQPEAYYIRCRVLNTKSALAKSCRAYLVNIERLGPSGAWEATPYCESMQLTWVGRGDGGYTALDLPKNVPHFIDVVSVREISRNFQPSIQVHLKRYESLYSSEGTYRLTVVVSGDCVTPASIGISFKWTGEWDNFEVKEAEPAI